MSVTNRHAHLATRGPCSLTYASQTLGRKIFTCGSDGLIKLHDLERGADEDEPEENDRFHEGVYAIAASPNGKLLAAGGPSLHVGLFKQQNLEFEDLIARCTMPVRDLCFSPDSDFLAVACDDSVIKIVSVDDKSNSKNLEGHSGGVKSIAFDPKGQYLASAGCDRTLRIWDVATGAQVSKHADIFSKDSASALMEDMPETPKNMCKVAWSGIKGISASPGQLLAVAGSTQVKVFERSTWNELEAFPAYGAEISIVEFSPNGKYLLTVDVQGEMVIWNVEERNSVARRSNGQKILAAHWDLLMNTICAISEEGRWGAWNSAVPDKYQDPTEREAEAEGASEDEGSADEGDDFDLDEIEARAFADKDVSSSKRDHPARGMPRAPAYPQYQRQEPFQLQSTKMEHKRRFMAYTTLGFITSRTEAAFNAIEIEFADVNTHRPVRFNDYSGFTMAAMGENAAAFASPGDPSSAEDAGSALHYRAFSSWAPNADWTHNFPAGEQITTLAVCKSHVAITTSKNFLRIFTISGMEKHVYRIPGPCVCMHGCDNLLACVYHLPSSPSSHGDQDLELMVLDVRKLLLVARQRVSLSPGSTLEWLHVLESGLVGVMDSDGVVAALTPESGGQWTPLLDIKTVNKPRDWFWPIGLDEKSLTGVVCKIEKRYPDVVQPVVVSVALSVPLLRGDADPLEEDWHRGRLLMAHNELAGVEGTYSTREHDNTLCRLLDAAINSGKQHRALDLVMNMRTPMGLNLAHCLASKKRLSGLAERIDRVRQDRAAAMEEEEEEEEEERRPSVQARRQREASEEVEEVEESDAKRARVSSKVEEAEEEDVGTDDDDAGRVNGADNIGTPPSAAARRESGHSLPFHKKTLSEGVPKEKLSFQDRIQSMRQKVPEPAPRPTGRPGLGGGVFGRPAKAQPVKAKKRA